MENFNLPPVLWPFAAALFVTAIITAATSLPGFRLTGSSSKQKLLRRIIPSPRETLIPFLSHAQVANLPYPPNLLPGARDVDTLHGTMRIYEWGPEHGRKVLLLHGDTSPAPVLGLIANALVKKGCRVMVFDLWGRGYSDAPADVPYDARLFTTQILVATASSSLSWNGAASGGFSIIAFSLGGGICMSFAAHFPYLVNSIVLLGPGGILRYLPREYETTLVRYPRLVPFNYLRRVVGSILGVKLSQPAFGQINPVDQDQSGPEVSQEVRVLRKEDLDIPAIVQWQFDYHYGFVHSFMNTIKHGPLMHQHPDWEKACNVIKGDAINCSPLARSSRLFNSKILVIFGDNDGVVVGKHVSEDLSEMIGGTEHVEFKVVPGGHDFPVPSSEEVVRHISQFWGLQPNA